jgi:hypothetical protein
MISRLASWADFEHTAAEMRGAFFRAWLWRMAKRALRRLEAL